MHPLLKKETILEGFKLYKEFVSDTQPSLQLSLQVSALFTSCLYSSE